MPKKKWKRRRLTADERKLVQQVKAGKSQRESSPLQYNDLPELAFIVHSFNRATNIDSLAKGLRRLGDHELIVCEDGSLDGSHEKWMSYLKRPNDFLLHSNDIHEIRILDRAIRFARAEIICLVQDDDRIPRGTGWLKRALGRFKAHPQLAIIGGFMGFRSFHPKPQKAKRIWGQVPFQFVQHVNIGPYFIRKQHYEALGGWDHSFSQAGEPGICFDNELCLRAWLKGYQVGYSFVPFKGPPGHYSLDGGTVLFSGSVRRQNQIRNQKKIYAMYSKDVRLINRCVRQANRGARLL
jgi:glycosyltransferase involved in cell wall biosynthesis